MSIKNIFLCCHPNAAIIQISGILLGTYAGYAYSKRVIMPTYTAPTSKPEKPAIALSERDKLNILDTEIEQLERPSILAPVDFLSITNSTLEYMGPLYAVVQAASGFIIIGRTLYSVIRLLQQYGLRVGPGLPLPNAPRTIVQGNIVERPLNINDLNNLRRDIRDVMNDGNENIRNLQQSIRDNNIISTAAANDIQQLTGKFISNTEITQGGLNKIANEIIQKLEQFGAHNNEISKGILESLDAIKKQIEKQGGDVSEISKKIETARILLGEDVMIVPRHRVELIEYAQGGSGSFTVSEPENIPSPINTENVNVMRENQNILNNINTELRNTETAETVRNRWLVVQGKLFDKTESGETKPTEQDIKKADEILDELKPSNESPEIQSARLRNSFIQEINELYQEFRDINSDVLRLPSIDYRVSSFDRSNSGPITLSFNIQTIRNLLTTGSADFQAYFNITKIKKFNTTITSKSSGLRQTNIDGPINIRLTELQNKFIRLLATILVAIEFGKLSQVL